MLAGIHNSDSKILGLPPPNQPEV